MVFAHLGARFCKSLRVSVVPVSLCSALALPPFTSPLGARSQSTSGTAPSSNVDAPAPLAIGELAKGRQGDSRANGRAHYWLVTLPPGAYKVVLDVRRADDQNGNVGGTLDWFSTDGQRLETLGSMNAVDDRFRSVFGFALKSPLKAILSYSNDFTVSDYWLGVFRSDAPLTSPFFAKPPTIYPLKLSEPATTVLHGDQPVARDAYYSIQLAAGDYKVSAEYRRTDGARNNVGGHVWLLDADGSLQGELHMANDIAVFARQINKLSLAEPGLAVFKVRALFAIESVSLTIEPFDEPR